MILSEEQIEHFFREGYVVVRGLIPESTVAAAKEVADKHLAANFDDHLAHGGRKKGWQPVSFKPDQIGPEDAVLHGVIADERLEEAASQLLGPNPRLLHGMLAAVPPGGDGLPWHQDNMYFHIFNAANVFVALAPIKQNMAILWVGPRSHVKGVLGSHKAGEETGNPGHREADHAPENAIPLPDLNPGDACIFDRSTLHHSKKNETDLRRYAYACQVMASNSRESQTGKLKPGKSLKEIRKLLRGE